MKKNCVDIQIFDEDNIKNDWDFTFIKIWSFFNLHTLNIE